MKVTEAKQIRQLTDVAEVNECLAKGWEIIKIFSVKENENLIRPTYILGTPSLNPDN